MKAKELIKRLQAIPEDMEVMCDTQEIIGCAKVGMKFNGEYKEYFSLFDDEDDYVGKQRNFIK
jgi:hypothetical protein